MGAPVRSLIVSVRRFPVALGLVAAGGLVLRLAYVLIELRDRPLGGDSLYYSLQGKYLAHGHAFIEPYLFVFQHKIEPSAVHPPLFSTYLGVVSFIGGDTGLAHRIAACFVGTAAVLVIGVVAARLAGPRAGLIAAGLAALYPYLWINDAVVLSESLLALVTALMLLAAYTFWRDPSCWRAAALGAGIALVALTRAEGAMLFVFLAVPFALTVPGLDPRRRLERLGFMALAALLLLGPWVAYNLNRFDEPVLLSTGAGVTLADSNCDSVYSGPDIGWWDLKCIPRPKSDEESVNDRRNRDTAFRFIGHHRGQVPTVVLARIGRMWGLFRPLQTAVLDGRGLNANRIGLVTAYGLMSLAIAGLVVLRRRRKPLLPMLTLAVMVTITAALSYGAIRFRIPADVAIVICAAVALDGWVGWYRSRQITPPEMRSEP